MYAYDEKSGTALWTCPVAKAADYTITFCPSSGGGVDGDGADYIDASEDEVSGPDDATDAQEPLGFSTGVHCD